MDEEAAPNGIAIGIGCVVYMVAGITQLFGCFELFEYWGWGAFASIAVMTLLLVFGLSPLIAIGCFFGAQYGWDWHWLGALALAAPGLALSVLFSPLALIGRRQY